MRFVRGSCPELFSTVEQDLDTQNLGTVEITREALRDLLENWRNGALSDMQVHQAAEEMASSGEMKDWDFISPDGSGNHIACMVVSELEMLHLDLITKDDVPFFLVLLELPESKVEEAMSATTRRFSDELWNERKAEIKARYGYESYYGNIIDLPDR